MTRVDTRSSWPEGLRRTPARLRLIQVLDDAKTPLTVRQIVTRLDPTEEERVWPSTLYRSLEQLVRYGLVNQTMLPDGSQSVYGLNRHGSRHYAFCLSCRKIIPVEQCPVQPEATRIADSGFVVTGHALELFGYCSTCRAAHPKRS